MFKIDIKELCSAKNEENVKEKTVEKANLERTSFLVLMQKLGLGFCSSLKHCVG